MTDSIRAVKSAEVLHRELSVVAKATFRPDIEGLRAVAVGLVLLFHGYHKPFSGGFVGVDVFFVISGFLITSLLLREHTKTGRISILGFYARRARRILPAATLLIVVTMLATYYFLGFIAGNQIAVDAKWTAVFAANIHFGLLGTDYLGAQLPPSPLQHMWSLGVEEQFYLVWPGLFLLLILVVRGARHRAALTAVLLGIITAALAWSIIQTASDATWAYFSPLTRAWELALGALVSVGAPVIARAKGWLVELAAGCGIAGIIAGALVLNSSTHYPGSAVALPVVSTGLVIAAGCADERTLVGQVLSVRPMQWIGARSYSLYLWHWPFLVIAAQYAGNELSGLQNTGLLVGALLATMLTYQFIENPIRRSRFLAKRTGLTLIMGVVLIVVAVGAAQALAACSPAHPQQPTTSTAPTQRDYATTALVLQAVRDAQQLNALSGNTAALLTKDENSPGDCFDRINTNKPAGLDKDLWGTPVQFGECAIGDRNGAKLMVMFGDSRAAVWSAPLEIIAEKNGWKLRVFGMGGCEVADMPFWSNELNAPNTVCDTFRSAAIPAIQALHPDLVIMTSAGEHKLADHTVATPAQWQSGMARTFQKLAGPRLAMIGPIPYWPNDDARCLAAHSSDVQACSTAAGDLVTNGQEAPLAAAATAANVLFISPKRWVCADRCEPVIADTSVYSDTYHFSFTYARYLAGALGEALQPALQ